MMAKRRRTATKGEKYRLILLKNVNDEITHKRRIVLWS